MSNPTRYSTDFLISILDSAGIPEYLPGVHGYVSYPAKDGWTVHVFRHCDMFDCVADWETPDGEFIGIENWVDEHDNASEDYLHIARWQPNGGAA